MRIIANITLSVLHINSKGIYHRDIKPENFLVKYIDREKFYLILSDFGLALTKIEY